MRFIACAPGGLVMRMDRARQASDVSVVVGLGVRDNVTLAEGAPERERALDTDADADADANANTEREGVLEMELARDVVADCEADDVVNARERLTDVIAERVALRDGDTDGVTSVHWT